MNIVAMTIPGIAYTTFMLCSSRNVPSAVLGPKSKITINPTIIGDTAKGRSIKALMIGFNQREIQEPLTISNEI
ncbi:hypothetical protein D3C85_1154260 [compost metagenome]